MDDRRPLDYRSPERGDPNVPLSNGCFEIAGNVGRGNERDSFGEEGLMSGQTPRIREAAVANEVHSAA